MHMCMRYLSGELVAGNVETVVGGLSYIEMEAAYGGGALNQFRRMSSCSFCSSGDETPGTA
jgi:hypothetical protein